MNQPESKTPIRHPVLVAALLLGLGLGQPPTTLGSDTAAASKAAKSDAVVALPADAHAFSHHEFPSPDGAMQYTATAAALTLRDDKGRPSSRIFYIAYAREDNARRPLTFVFNGGPGAASAYLHLGALGPRRVVFGDDGSVPAPPVSLADNPDSWLAFTDLVFVDPPGTGYSRLLGEENADATEHAKDGGGKVPPWGIEEDADILADFIRRYLTDAERWASPIFLAGESYGGFRVALLAERLYAKEGIATSGVVLISPVLDFALIRGGEEVLLRWGALLPSYAAVASHYGLGPNLQLDARDPRAALHEVERYALGDLLLGLARGDVLEPGAASEMMERLSAYTGLPVAELRRHRARVPASRFAKVLLEDRRRLVSLYDGSLAMIDPDPAASHIGRDLYLDRLGSALTAGFHVLVRDTLQFESELPYRLLNRQVSKAWNWDSGIGDAQGFADVLDDLSRALSLNPAMRVLVLHGVHDLVTPYFASAISLSQMGLAAELRPNVRLVVYPGGHMFYTRRDSRERLREDADRFYREALEGRAAQPEG